MMRAVAVLLFVAAPAIADSEVGRSFRTVVPAAGVEHVSVQLSVGEVSIRSASEPRIELAAAIRREYDGRRERQRAEKIVQDTDIEVLIRGDRAIIREKLGPAARRGSSRWVKSEIEVRITLPPGVNLVVEQSVGRLDIRGDFHDVEVDMRVGEMSLRLPKKNVKELSAGTTIGEVHADVGDRVLTREGIFAGRTHYVNEAGVGVVDLQLNIGEIDVSLQ